jgi:hypothetical protein
MPRPDWDKRYVAGKGSWRRPEDNERYRDNFDRIFRAPGVSCDDCRHLDWISDWCDLSDASTMGRRSNPPCGGERFERDERA